MSQIGYMLFVNGIPVHFSTTTIDTTRYGDQSNLVVKPVFA